MTRPTGRATTVSRAEPGQPNSIVPDGPGQEKQPQVEADRKARLVGFVEFNKMFTGG